MRLRAPLLALLMLGAWSGPLARGEEEALQVRSIDVGRQLFVDDFLIDATTLTRAFHTPRLHEKNPVLKPETALEMNDGRDPVAAPFDDGVFYDPKDQLFKMWYHGGWFDGNCYAESSDGVTWRRPILDVAPGTNRVLPVRKGEVGGGALMRDATTVWLDHEAVDPSQRFKMFVYSRETGQKSGVGSKGEVLTSADGIHWKDPVTVGFKHGDNSSFYHDPFRQRWVYSVRDHARSLIHPDRSVRARFYLSNPDFFQGVAREEKGPSPWLQADPRDLPDPELGYEPELYDFTAVAYESLMVGVFGIFYGPPNDIGFKEKRPKIIDLQVGYSRDGYHWERPDRRAFLASERTQGTWNRAYLHPATGVCLVVGDELYFYFGAWSGVSPTFGTHIYAGGSTGLAILRRDGFASMDALDAPGTLTTRPLRFSGKHAFVNVDAKAGALRMEVLDVDGAVIAPYTRENCVPIAVDGTRRKVEWKGADDLASLAGKPVRFRFSLANGKLYSFWVSPDRSGASHGYVAAGGPGFPGSRDTVGGGESGPSLETKPVEVKP